MSDETVGTIELSTEQKQWFAGIVAGSKVTEEHAGTDFPDFVTRVKMWWFYVGVLCGEQAAGEGWEKVDQFMLGASLRQPVEDEAEQL